MRRRTQFVGRARERRVFARLLGGKVLRVLFVHGVGGVGKTALLQSMRATAARARIPTAYIDLRFVPAEPDALVRAIAEGLAPPGDRRTLESLGRCRRHVLLVDNYESLGAARDFFRDVLLPALSERVAVVIAGREGPDAAWRALPGWGSLLEALPLRNLNARESAAFLRAQRVPAHQRPAILAFTHGHPLALTLVSEVVRQRPDRRFAADGAIDVVRALLEIFVGDVSDREQRLALEAACVVRRMTEPLLEAMTGIADPHGLLQWLARRSFVEHGRSGLFLHDLVREALEADLRWRAPERFDELRRRAHAFYAGRIETDPHAVWIDLMFLLRTSAVARVDFGDSSGLSVGAARADEAQEIVALVAQHEGPHSARLARKWLDAQPEVWTVVRSSSGRIEGLLATVRLECAPAALRRDDPGTRAAWRWLEATAPLRRGESATMYRFWMARDAYQRVSPAQTHVGTLIFRANVLTPRLAASFFPVAEPDYYRPQMNFTDTPELSAFKVGGRAYTVFGRDWRQSSPPDWIAQMERRARAMGAPPPSPPAPPLPLVLLSEERFAEEVRAALRGYASPTALAQSPLLRSRVVAERTGSSAGVSERVDALRGILHGAALALTSADRGGRLADVLRRTYLEPASKQLAAAGELGLSFGTYRRYLGRALELLVTTLWRREIGEP